ncbi:hypothetical protein VPNG_01952 [Cytospora leucostoma]|uniref:Uncharacterized protein n=1 Tax=Cytospora leucostoma TaxID=1230097 RepID=A0A423XJA0_9PEZI|nr:hypothetical protein VPNG_01952 [Cytospora leucostoma]
MDMDSPQLVQTLIESFNALAGEVQDLVDRKTILEHKLRFAHEQYQLLADKYAPAAPHIAETLAKLQLPASPPLTPTNHVPLPRRQQSDSSQVELALYIREGRKVAQQLAMLTDVGKASGSSRETTSINMTSPSTVLEKDFTVEGKKGRLGCPFSALKKENVDADNVPVDGTGDSHDPTPPPQTGDPICATMLVETTPTPAPNASASKCPIRYMDKHSPEEIAHYVETHKHELPRSHEVCLRRNQKNEEQIRKLDAKYGNVVSMIEDLSHLHAPMLPSSGTNQEAHSDVDRASNRRVCDWAQGVSESMADRVADGLADEADKDGEDCDVPTAEQFLERTNHFDRPLKEVRVGESPSRPWGISVPFPPDKPVEWPSSPPAPVRIPSPEADHTPKAQAAKPSKCPFDHTKMRLDGPGLSEFPKMEEGGGGPPPPIPHRPAASQPFAIPAKPTQPLPPDSPPPSHQPAFINLVGASKEGAAGGGTPQMVFNGPVFIGYPIEEAIRFMQHFQTQPR